MYKFKINKITVDTIEGTQNIIPKNINVLVGPNNSGKSRLLREIRDYISGDTRNIKIIKNISHTFPESFEDMDSSYKIMSKIEKDFSGNWMLKTYSNKPNQGLDMNSSLESYYTRSSNYFREDWKTEIKDLIQNNNYNMFFQYFGALFFQYMGTEERLTICKMQKNYGMDNGNTNYLSSFKFQSEQLHDLSDKLKKLFHKDIFLDNQTLGERLVFRIGDDFKYARNLTEYSEDAAAKLFSEDLLDNQGDGIKSFVSTFLSLNHNTHDILLIDEPEAFLHPPLARQLGEMRGGFNNEECNIFIATHSVEILKGILSKNTNVNVIRITRPEEERNKFMFLNQETLNSILQKPLLRVSRVLEGVFCEKVIITEAEADELVYQELIEKIYPESGLYFAHGQNKQTLAEIAQLYEKIGIGYEIITDFDVLRVPTEFYKFLSIMPLGDKERQRIKNYAEKLRQMIDDSVETEGLSNDDTESKKKEKRNEVYHKQGIRFFDKDVVNQEKIRNTLEKLSSMHLHILETGELETLLEDYDISYKEKNKWIIEAINKISSMEKSDIEKNSRMYNFIKKIIENNVVSEKEIDSRTEL